MGPRIERPTTTRFRDSKVSKSRCHKDKEDTTESHREYYRIKQQRYRERQRECEEVLENATRQLKNEIGQLKRLRDQLTFQVPRSLTVWIVATEYLRIIRRHLTLQGSVRFDWDEENKRVIRLHHQVDMVSALVHILGNLEDVATLFNGAQMTPECVVRDNLGSVAFSCDTE
ncbi:hypothetical protein JG687_00007905 [Phytophthora cactorum]|uniref:BZIP domain-containing protein n=1 Tax=Phytophthora cactorum TaxID=29920 RepID=A0A8T1UH00_9STRA|nr:hypothetical protein JG687_00007905 [Phytophthora cactorum]